MTKFWRDLRNRFAGRSALAVASQPLASNVTTGVEAAQVLDEASSADVQKVMGIAIPTLTARLTALHRPSHVLKGPTLDLSEQGQSSVRQMFRIAYFAENAHSSTFRYRVHNMIEALALPEVAQSLGYPVFGAFFFEADVARFHDIAQSADVLVISRARYSQALVDLVTMFRAQGKRVIYDIDDWVFSPQHVPMLVHTLGQDRQTESTWDFWFSVTARMQAAMRLADAAIAPQAQLAHEIDAAFDFEAPCAVIPNFFNLAQIGVSEPLWQERLGSVTTKPFTPHLTVRFGYFSGSASHGLDFALCKIALMALMRQDPHVQLVLVGHVDGTQTFGDVASQVRVLPFCDYLDLPKAIASVDFNLVPLQQNRFTNCKSDLKFTDAALVGVPTLASPAWAYTHAIQTGHNGWLVDDADWLHALQQAVALRRTAEKAYLTIAEAARQTALQRYHPASQGQHLLQALGLLSLNHQ